MKAPIESYRTRAAKLASAAKRLSENAEFPPAFSLAFFSDRKRTPNPDLVVRAMPAGTAFILRDYAHPRRNTMAQQLRSVCATRKILFFVGEDVTLGKAIKADGIHWPSWTSPMPVNGMLTSAACHNARELDRAGQSGIDVAFLSPVYPTRSHPDGDFLGAAIFKKIAAQAALPVLALGGIDETNACHLRQSNVAGFGAIDGFLQR